MGSQGSLSPLRRIENRTGASRTTTMTGKCEHPSAVTDFMIRCIIALYERGISRHASSREFREFRENARNGCIRGAFDVALTRICECRSLRGEMRDVQNDNQKDKISEWSLILKWYFCRNKLRLRQTDVSFINYFSLQSLKLRSPILYLILSS